MKNLLTTIGLALIMLLLSMRLPAQARPDGRHCGDVGPLPIGDANFCGCTWGEVLYRGQPISGAQVTLSFNGQITAALTRLMPTDIDPVFDLTAYSLGAQRGDLLTITAQFAGQAISRTIRAWPEADGEQHLALAIPEYGQWSPWLTDDYTRAIVLRNDQMWAGGTAGIISIEVSSGISVALTPPLTSVMALVTASDGRLWAGGSGGLAVYDGNAWSSPFFVTRTVRALTVNIADGAVWAGGDENGSGWAAVYTDSWQTAGAFPSRVNSLVVDINNRVWAGTDGNGVYRYNGVSWEQFTTAAGLASNSIGSSTATSDAVWFGTAPYLTAQGPRGGIARYDLIANTWRTFTMSHGLPADAAITQTAAAVYALAVDPVGVVWAGTTDGVRYLAEDYWWAYTATHGLRAGPVRALAVSTNLAVAAVATGLDRFDPAATIGLSPTADIASVSPLTVTPDSDLQLIGGGLDADENAERIVAWDWSSSLAGPLCTVASCTLPYALLPAGQHELILSVQDDEGYWSMPISQTVIVAVSARLFLPSIMR